MTKELRLPVAPDLSMPLESDTLYECPGCGESNYIGVDPTAGRKQHMIEDCQVCCKPIAFVIEIDREGDALVVSAELAD